MSTVTVTRKPLQFLGSSHDDLNALPDEARRDAGLNVLHCFQKKTEKTSQRDIALAKKRFQSIPNLEELSDEKARS